MYEQFVITCLTLGINVVSQILIYRHYLFRPSQYNGECSNLCPILCREINTFQLNQLLTKRKQSGLKRTQMFSQP